MLGGLLLGWFSPTEIAAVTVFYALFLGVVVYRELTWKDIVKKCARRPCARRRPSCSVVAAAALFAYVITIMQLPQAIPAGLLG